MTGRIIRFCDTTLRDGEQTPGVHFGAAQKYDIAMRLEQLGADIIEAGFPASSEGDFAAVRRVAESIRESTVSALARLTKSDIDAAASALEGARKRRIHVFIATSDIHLKHKLNITREDALARIREYVAYAREFFDEVQFSPEDATRSDADFLLEAVKCAAEAGANIINIPDTVGYSSPDEFSALVRRVKAVLPPETVVSVHCHNDLGMATANTIAAVTAGADQVECTVNGLGERAGNTPFEEAVMAITVRAESMGVSHNINTRELIETSRLISSLSGIRVAPNKAIVGANAFAHASGIHQHGMMCSRKTYEIMNPEDIGLTDNTIVLGKLSGRHAFAERVAKLGYSLDGVGIDAAFTRFKEIADKKSVISDDDIRAIVSEYLDSIEGRYYLSTFQIQSGNKIKAMCLVTLSDGVENGEVTEAAPGEGPIDAAFNAINRIAGADGVELISYNIQALTEGTDALGEAKVKIKEGESVFTGRGVSTDIVKSSIKAYLNAINKWERARRRRIEG
ncbi:MAG: 2-isopropylmalate synthase [Ruminococcaceae bacterium]|nr:2-isopropylmalate synthase [Oscillospiraceae bacterium]